MSYPNDHTPEQHRAALGDMLRDIGCVEVRPIRRTCPDCGASVSWYAGCKAEPDTGTKATPAGDYCDDGCGWSDCLDPIDPATEWKYRRGA